MYILYIYIYIYIYTYINVYIVSVDTKPVVEAGPVQKYHRTYSLYNTALRHIFISYTHTHRSYTYRHRCVLTRHPSQRPVRYWSSKQLVLYQVRYYVYHTGLFFNVYRSLLTPVAEAGPAQV